MADSDPLLNLIPCDDWETPFVDAYGQFSLGFHQKNFGPAYLHPRSMISTYEIAMPVLQLWIHEQGQWHIIRRQSIESLPWMLRESARIRVSGQPVSIQSEYIFENSRRARARITWVNTGSQDVEFTPGFYGCLRDRNPEPYMLDYFPGAKKGDRNIVFNVLENGIETGLEPDPDNSDLPHVRFRVLSLSSELAATQLPGPIWGGDQEDDRVRFYSISSPAPLTLAADSCTSFEFIIDFRGAAAGEPLDPWESAAPTDWDPLLQKVEQRYKQRSGYDSLEPDLSISNGQLLKARSTILRTGVKGHNGEFGDHVASQCSAGTQDFSSSFFWDTFFTSTALSRFNPSFARDAITTAFTRQLERDGSTPERKWNYSAKQRMNIACPQSPIGAWALNHYLTLNNGDGDLQFARDLYPRLKANHLFWRDYSDADNDGLAEYNWSGQIGDDSPIWDSVRMSQDEKSGCFWMPPIASVTCNSFLFRDAREMARVAAALGEGREITFWKERAEQIADKMKEILWVEEDQRYWDYNHRTRAYNKPETFFMFLPLWAEVPMPDAARKDLIENSLLNPKKFFGPIPFPSVAYDHPTYDPGGYWRGKAWSHFSCWLTEVLWREGYRSEADEAANRIMAWQQMWDFRENMNTDPSELFPKGFPHYNWGSAAYCFLAERLYRQPSPLGTL